MYYPLTAVVILLQSLASVHATVSVTCAAPWVSTAVSIVDALPSSQGIIYCSSLLGKYKTTTVTTQKCSGTKTSTSTIGVKATATAPVATSTSTYTMIVYTTTTTTVSQKVESDIIRTITTPQTITSTIKDYFTSDVTSYVTTVADPHYKVKRDAAPANENAIEARSAPVSVNICSLVGIASSLLTGFCSCVAPGTTSISTSTVTSGSLCTAIATVTSTTATVTPSASVFQVAKTASSTAVASTASAIVVETVISTVQVTVTLTATVDVTVSSTIVDVAMPTDYYENWRRGQGGLYYDYEHYLGGYPNVGDSLSTATTDTCLDYCSATPGCITAAIQVTDPFTYYDCYLFSGIYSRNNEIGANNNYYFDVYRLISTLTDDDYD